MSARKSAITTGFLTGGMFGTIIGFSVFSWGVGFAMIKYNVPNPIYGRNVTVYDIVLTYQGLMFAMFTVI